MATPRTGGRVLLHAPDASNSRRPSPGLLQRSQRRIRLNPEAIPPGAEQFLNPIARRVLDILENGKSDHYSATYLQQKIPGASRGIKDLVQRGYAESYLETPARPTETETGGDSSRCFSCYLYGTDQTSERSAHYPTTSWGELWLTDLLQIARTTRPTISNLERRDCLVVEGREVLRREVGASVAADADKDLTPAQSQALQQILQQSDYCEMLLHGVTGSGKTEVYLQAIAPFWLNKNPS